MHPIVTMALKDIKLLLRDRLGAFFIFGFPVLMGIFFGLVIGGMGDNRSRGAMQVAMVDLDNTAASQRFAKRLGDNPNVELIAANRDAAQQAVRKGQYVAMIVVPAGFGDRVGALLGEPATLQLGADPSRSAEAAMLQGFVMQTMGTMISDRFNLSLQLQPMVASTRQHFESAENLGPQTRQTSLDFLQQLDDWLSSGNDDSADASDSATSGFGFEFANIESIDVTRDVDPGSMEGQLKKIRSRWDISFPQSMMWGVLGCVAGFTISIARERSLGTMVRLRVAPVSTFYVLAGKGLACFLSAVGVVVMMTCLGLLLGMRPMSFASLAVASLCIAFCFVGIMMTLSVLGRTEQSAAGIGWMCNMVMAMFGGCMVPVMFMPGFMQHLSVLSPIRWAILALEGAIWRQFTWLEMLTPCAILVSIGAVGITLGTWLLQRQTASS